MSLVKTTEYSDVSSDFDTLVALRSLIRSFRRGAAQLSVRDPEVVEEMSALIGVLEVHVLRLLADAEEHMDDL